MEKTIIIVGAQRVGAQFHISGFQASTGIICQGGYRRGHILGMGLRWYCLVLYGIAWNCMVLHRIVYRVLSRWLSRAHSGDGPSVRTIS